MPHAFPVLKEKTVKQGETLVEELKTSQEKSICQASELHAKEVEVLQSQVDKLKQDLSFSKDKTQELEKLVSELQTYKEQAQVSTHCQRCIHVSLISGFFCVWRQGFFAYY